MAISYDYELYVDGVRKFYHTATFTLAIQEDSFVDVGGNANGSYSYEEGAYLGWTDTQGDTVPVFEVGDEFTVHGKMYLYSIPAPQSTAKTIINGLNPVKKMFGTAEIVKEVLNGITVYEKSSPSISYSFSLSFDWNKYSPSFTIYDGQDNTGTLLGTISGGTTTLTGTCSTGYLFIDVGSSGSYDVIIMNVYWDTSDTSVTNMGISDMGTYDVTIQVTGDNASGILFFELD